MTERKKGKIIVPKFKDDAEAERWFRQRTIDELIELAEDYTGAEARYAADRVQR